MRSSLLLGVAGKPSLVPKYFVNASTGSDSNDGLTPATAWQTLAKVNASSFAPGDVIGFAGGQTFTGTQLVLANSGTSTSPIVFTSYNGVGKAIISTSARAFSSENIDNFTISNLIFVGSGSTVSTNNGIEILNSLTGNTKMNNITISGVEVHAYGLNGIGIYGGYGGGGSAGYDNLTILNSEVYDVLGNVSGNNGLACILCSGTYGTGQTNPSFTNVLIAGNITRDSAGKGDAANWAASGLIVQSFKDVLVTGHLAHDIGANGISGNGSGGLGVLLYDGENGTIQFSEAYNMHFNTHGNGTGFGLGGGNKNCFIQYCYSHDNDGHGFYVVGYNDGSVVGSPGATIRYCIGGNNGKKTGDYSGGALLIENDGGTSVFNVYNNTFYNTDPVPGTTTMIEFWMNAAAACSGYVANNIFFAANDCDFTICTGTQATTPTNLLLRGNDWYANASITFKWLGATYTSFAAWQTASGQEKIAGVNVGLTSNPQLVDPGNGGSGNYKPNAYRLLNTSPMISAGLDLNALFGINPGAVDIYGNPVPRGSAFNVGADNGPGV